MLEDNLGWKENKTEVQRLSFALNKPLCVTTKKNNQNLKEVILDNRQASLKLSLSDKREEAACSSNGRSSSTKTSLWPGLSR